jgi:hypothetical protein
MVRDERKSEDELHRFFDTATDAEELHLYADGFNWDCGIGELRRVIRHPLCDRGTAFLIYWRGAPGFMAQFADRSETCNPDQAEHYDLLREIEEKVMAGHFQTHRFRYDPRNDRGEDLTIRYSHIPQKRPIPQEMFT